MNLREGTRRLALLLGVAGAIVGGFASYMELQPIMRQRTDHQKFEQLANSKIVQQQRKSLQSPPDVIPDMSADNGAALGQDRRTPHIHLPKGFVLEQPGAALEQQRSKPHHKPMGKYTGDWFARNAPDSGEPQPQVDRSTAQPIQPQVDWSTAVPIPSVLMEDGIRTINWSHDYGVQSIETEDGQTLYPTPSPSRWSYFLIVILPILGFLIPWGAIRSIGWVGAGFVQSL